MNEKGEVLRRVNYRPGRGGEVGRFGRGRYYNSNHGAGDGIPPRPNVVGFGQGPTRNEDEIQLDLDDDDEGQEGDEAMQGVEVETAGSGSAGQRADNEEIAIGDDFDEEE